MAVRIREPFSTMAAERRSPSSGSFTEQVMPGRAVAIKVRTPIRRARMRHRKCCGFSIRMCEPPGGRSAREARFRKLARADDAPLDGSRTVVFDPDWRAGAARAHKTETANRTACRAIGERAAPGALRHDADPPPLTGSSTIVGRSPMRRLCAHFGGDPPGGRQRSSFRVVLLPTLGLDL